MPTRRLEPGQAGEARARQLPSGAWVARVKVGVHGKPARPLERRASTKSEALERVRAAARSYMPGSAELHSDSTVEHLATYWLEQRKLDVLAPDVKFTQKSYDAYESTVKAQIIPLMGQVRLRSFSAARVDDTLRAIRATRSDKQARTVLSQMGKLAVRHQAILVNPIVDVGRPQARRRSPVVLELDYIQGLLAHCRDVPNLHDVLALIAGSAGRISEPLAVRWEDLELPLDGPGTCTFAGHMVGSTWVPGRKHGAPALTVFLSPAVVEILRERKHDLSIYRGPESPVFPTSTGTFQQPNNFRRDLRNKIKGTEFEGFIPKHLRSTVAAWVSGELGYEAAVAQLGHTLKGVAADHYVPRAIRGPDSREVLQRVFEPDSSGASDGLTSVT